VKTSRRTTKEQGNNWWGDADKHRQRGFYVEYGGGDGWRTPSDLTSQDFETAVAQIDEALGFFQLLDATLKMLQQPELAAWRDFAFGLAVKVHTDMFGTALRD
jgi:hypothetical protein